ncbi:MAG: hypothetical protein EOO41_00135 [Methanobacteriota archaeon]|nr:MAG: hypothetical protein EOO41_00135 [Euryarchaeota archaeon]
MYWLVLPGVVANDGGLAAPNAMAALWPSRRIADQTAVTVGGMNSDLARSKRNPDDRVDKPTAKEEAEENAWEIAGDPTDVAVLVLGHKLGIEGNINSFKAQFQQIDKVPFESDYKFVAVMQDVDTPAGRKRIVYLKGAWDEVIRRCSTQAVNDNAFESAPCNQAFWLSAASDYAAEGMRVLAVAQWEVPADKTKLTLEELRDAALTSPCLQLNCLVAIIDPPRASAKRSIKECHNAGILVKMITGDHADTACFIAKDLGIISDEKFKEYLRVKDSDDEARRRIVLRGDEVSFWCRANRSARQRRHVCPSATAHCALPRCVRADQGHPCGRGA